MQHHTMHANCPYCDRDTNVTTKLALSEFSVLQCTSCSLVFLDVRQLSQELAELYGPDYFNTRQDYFFGDRQNEAQPGNIDEFMTGLDKLDALTPGRGSLLDVGCGVGVFLGLAQQRGWSVRGIDLSPFAAQVARDTAGLDVDTGKLEDAGYPSDSFDVVTLWDSIEHVADPVAVLSEVHRILRPGGYAMLNTPNENSLMKAIANVSYQATLGVFRYPCQKLYHHYHLYYFTEDTLSASLRRAGLEIVRIERSLIPIIKARGTATEKLIVKAFSSLEKLTGREYQLLALARKPVVAVT